MLILAQTRARAAGARDRCAAQTRPLCRAAPPRWCRCLHARLADAVHVKFNCFAPAFMTAWVGYVCTKPKVCYGLGSVQKGLEPSRTPCTRRKETKSSAPCTTREECPIEGKIFLSLKDCEIQCIPCGGVQRARVHTTWRSSADEVGDERSGDGVELRGGVGGRGRAGRDGRGAWVPAPGLREDPRGGTRALRK